jgi:hypothetical protein
MSTASSEHCARHHLPPNFGITRRMRLHSRAGLLEKLTLLFSLQAWNLITKNHGLLGEAGGASYHVLSRIVRTCLLPLCLHSIHRSREHSGMKMRRTKICANLARHHLTPLDHIALKHTKEFSEQSEKRTRIYPRH